MTLLVIAFTFCIGFLANAEETGDPSWKEADTEGVVQVGGGRMKRFVQIDPNKPNVMYQECSLPNGKAGHCKHIQYCLKDDIKDNLVHFTENLCIIEQRTIGICCADETGPVGLAGDLPATAPREERRELLQKLLVRAENRGCGLSTRPHGRLTGARPANAREWPWMASVTPEGFRQYCGGVLITDRHVLTAAHCTRRSSAKVPSSYIASLDPTNRNTTILELLFGGRVNSWKASDLRVRLGEYDFERSNDSRSYNFNVVEIRQHANFELPNYHNDIAILKLHRPAVFNSYVWPICLPPVGLQLTNESAVIIGWGTKWYGGPNSDILMEVSVPIWDLQQCSEALVNSVFEENLCAGGYEGGKDACQGDSGGPLMYQLPSGRWTIIGIVSWGVRCGEPNHPGIYTRVDKYLSWIVQNVQF